MSVPIRSESAARAQPGPAVAPTLLFFTLVLAPALLLAGCSALPPAPVTGTQAADPNTPAPAAGYQSTIAPYASRRPVEPGSWREQNERVAPAPRQ